MASCKQCLGTVSYINNSLMKCDYCGRLYSVINGEMAEANKAQIYESAVSRAKSKNVKTMQEAIELFDALDAYKDSEVKMIECKEFIRKQKNQEEEQKREEIRRAEKEEEKAKKQAEQQEKMIRLKRMCIVGTVLCVAIIVGIVGIVYTFKKNKYEKAMEFYEQEQYEEALTKFDSLGSFKDSETMVVEVSNLIVERDNYYAQGVSYYNSGLYEKAIEQFLNIPNYSDVSDYIENASNELYQEANILFENQEYLTAKEKLIAIPSGCDIYTQAQTLLVQAEEILAEQERAADYDAAVKYYEEGQYDTAHQLFVGLGDYADVKEYLSTIGTMYYSEAQELYNAGSYVECAEKLDCIDTADEWAEYTVALELKQQATDVYYNLVMEEAKRICRSEGDAAMATYLDSAVCLILTEDDVTVLKESCHIERISLSEMEPYVTDGGGLEVREHVKYRTDTLGNVYEFTFYAFDDYRSSNTYYLNGEYEQFTATVAIAGKDNPDGQGAIRIYGDEKLLWSDENIRNDTKPYIIEINISGVEDLKIEMRGDEVGSFGNSKYLAIILCDPILIE